MASSMAEITTSGSMCFSRLSISICWYSRFAIFLILKFDHEIRFADQFQRNLHRRRFFALQLHANVAPSKSLQPSFEKLGTIDGLRGGNFCQPPHKALEVRLGLQRSVHPG